jgi:hypothetical protein
MPLAAIAVSRNPALMAIRWTSGRHDLVLLTSSAGVALVWLSIICAGGVAETRHVFQSRAR